MNIQKNLLTKLALGLMATALMCSVSWAQKPEPVLTQGTPVSAGESAADKAWREGILGMNDPKKIVSESPKESKTPTTRVRGDQVYNCGSKAFKGKCTMYGFGNYDMTNDRNLREQACGQAALATAIWDRGSYDVMAAFKYDTAAFARDVFKTAPPKVTIAGWLTVGPGTDWRQFNYGLDQYKKYGIKYSWFKGEAELQKQVAMGNVVAVMIDLGTLPSRYAMRSGAHWVIIYGYDDEKYYVTNFTGNVLYKSDLRDAWGASPDWRVGVWAKGHGTAGMGVVIYK